MVVYLDLEDLLHLTRRLGAGPVRDPGLLAAAAGRPATTVFGADAYPSLEEKAAALLHSLCGNHALVDGNKRLGWLATLVFLSLNDLTVEMPDDDAFGLVMSVADGSLDVAQIAERLREATCPSTAS